jgi:hypothetical protein
MLAVFSRRPSPTFAASMTALSLLGSFIDFSAQPADRCHTGSVPHKRFGSVVSSLTSPNARGGTHTNHHSP